MADLLAAAAFLRDRYQAPGLLIGHSLGGAAVRQAAAHLSDLRAVATIAAPSEARHVLRLLEPARLEIEARGCAIVQIGERSFPISKRFLDDIERCESLSHSRFSQIGSRATSTMPCAC